MINSNLQKPKLKNENLIIKNFIKKKNIKYLINLENSFSLKNENISKIRDLIVSQTDKNKKISILIISNLSFQIFNRTFLEKLTFKEINAKIEYTDHNSFLNSKKININKYNFILFFPDTTDFHEISQVDDDMYFKKIYYKQITIFYDLLIKKISCYNAKVFIGNFVNFEKLDFGTYTKKLDNLKSDLINKLNKYLLKITKDKR